ncbi:MAG: carbohydrate ABC transporter permease [Ruminococcaceae bacterium]|nr:carbohydrate ABC transporter permease [Oscillospiraceae bacterium]
MSIKVNRKNRIKQGSVLVDILIYALVGIVALVTVYPFLYIVSSSISDPQMVQAGKVWLYPVGFSTEAYKRVLQSSAMLRAFINSILYTIVITVTSVFVSMMTGYAMSKKGMLGRKFLTIYLLIPMFFSAGTIPAFININNLGIYNTLWAVILPYVCSIWNIVLARTFISGLPKALFEAATIDGASVPQMFIKIVLPLSKPIIAVLSLYTALWAWNQWFNFLIYAPSLGDWHPLQYFLVKALLWGNAQNTLKLESQMTVTEIADRLKMAAVSAQYKYAIVVITTVPIMLVYPFVQKYFVQGAMLGSLKE